MKKVVSLLLAFVLLISSFGFAFSAFAVNGNTKTEGKLWDTPISFKYYEETNTLELYGKGKTSAYNHNLYMNEFGFFYEQYSWYSEVKHIDIKEGVEDLISVCFYGCENLETVNIPKSMKAIHFAAFTECKNLTDIYYAGKVTHWNKIDFSFEYTGNHGIIVEYRDKNYVNSIMYTYPKIHIMGSKTGWVTENKKTYYLTDENIVYYGKERVDGKDYIFRFTTGELLKGRVTCGGVRYIASKADGHLLTGKVRCDNKYYILSKLDGHMLYGRAQCNGKKYITSPKTGEIQYGKVSFDGRIYIANKKYGYLYPNSKVKCDGKNYRTDETGAVL